MTAPRERPILFSGPMVRAILDGRKTQTRRIAEPLHVVPRSDVHSDMPSAIFGLTGDAGRAADEAIRSVAISGGRRYPAGIGGRGAVFAELHHGEGRLGLKPGEFDFVCPYADGRTYLDRGWRIDIAVGSRLWVRETHAIVPRLSGGERTVGDETVRYQSTWDKTNTVRWRPSIHMPRWASRLLLEVTEVRVQRLTEITEHDARAEGVDATEHTARDMFAALWTTINGDRAPWSSNPWVWAISFRRVP